MWNISKSLWIKNWKGKKNSSNDKIYKTDKDITFVVLLTDLVSFESLE